MTTNKLQIHKLKIYLESAERTVSNELCQQIDSLRNKTTKLCLVSKDPNIEYINKYFNEGCVGNGLQIE